MADKSSRPSRPASSQQSSQSSPEIQQPAGDMPKKFPSNPQPLDDDSIEAAKRNPSSSRFSSPGQSKSGAGQTDADDTETDAEQSASASEENTDSADIGEEDQKD
ncbi:MAG TPA: hypothetical protein VL200_06485 [Lacunisphaera sp.]|jgi:hypothetical protein|nr:hypothetical protein [Lacunisphaera sp.]